MKFLHNLETSSKLLAAFAIVLGLTTLLGVNALSRMSDIDRASSELSGKWLPQTIAALSLRNDLLELRKLEHVVAGDKDSIDDATQKNEQRRFRLSRQQRTTGAGAERRTDATAGGRDATPGRRLPRRARQADGVGQ